MLSDIFKKKGKPIPFKTDLLFNFFNKKTISNANYVQDPISSLKLYPAKSGCVKPTALSTGIKLPTAEIDLIGKVEVKLHHKLADVLNGYVWAAENSAGPDYATTGLYLNSTKTAYNSYFKGSISGGCAILTSAMEDDNYYILTTDFNTDNVVMKANKVTKVNNAEVVGSDINGSTTAKGTGVLTADIGLLSGRNNTAFVLSSKHKIVYFKIYDKSNNLMHQFNFSEGAGSKTYDVVTGNSYDISNITPVDFWNQKQDFNHYNFANGFTLYQKDGEPDMRIPNKLDGSEIPLGIETIPSGYVRIANFKKAGLTWNKAESLVKLDDVTIAGIQVSGAVVDITLNGTYTLIGSHSGNPLYQKIGGSTSQRMWKNDYAYGWNIGNFLGSAYFQEHPAGNGTSSPPFPYQATFLPTSVGVGNAICVLTSTSALYTADVDHFLFTENTGVAKEFDLNLINIASISDRGYLYYNETLRQNFMLYATNKTLADDVKIIKYLGMSSRINYDESGLANYDESNHVELTEV